MHVTYTQLFVASTVEGRGEFGAGYTPCRPRVRMWVYFKIGPQVREHFLVTPRQTAEQDDPTLKTLEQTRDTAAMSLFSPDFPTSIGDCLLLSLRLKRYNPPSISFETTPQPYWSKL